jgi:hypothetical protein
MVTVPGLSNSRPPFKVYRDSSLEIAKTVFWMAVAKTFAGSVAKAGGTVGNMGKLSLAIPTNLKDERSHVTCTQWFSNALK